MRWYGFGTSDIGLAAAALVAIAVSLWHLVGATVGIDISRIWIGETPATLFTPAEGSKGPAIVIAHGFAGSQQLMQAFAVTLARNGYTAVTFDFLGHGRNPRPLSGSITDEGGATATLVRETAQVAAFAKSSGDGRLALLGHSMASDIVVRVAEADPAIAATVAVSMFSPAVTKNAPRNLLVIVGAWEGTLEAEALRAVGLVSAPAPPRLAMTYGSFPGGSARRAVVAPHVEHIGVLFSTATLRETIDWLDQAFARPRVQAPYLDGRGLWLVLLFVGIVGLARPLSKLLPVASSLPQGASLPWRTLWPAIIAPMIATPLILRWLPTDFLAVPIGSYLFCHLALYGILTALIIVWMKRGLQKSPAKTSWPRVALGALAVGTFAVGVLGSAIDEFLTSLTLNEMRVPLFAATLVGASIYFIAGEWLVRGEHAARAGFACLHLAFLVSLAIAVAIDFERLFFLMIIVPAIIICLIIAGLFSRWSYARTRHPAVGAVGNAFFLAFAISATFPILAG